MEKTDKSQNNVEQIIADERIICFGERLKNLMGVRSYRTFASACGMSEKVIRNYVKGDTYPSLDRLEQIARANNVTAEWLAFGMIEDNNTEPMQTGPRNSHSTTLTDEDAELLKFVHEMDRSEIDCLLRVLRRRGVNVLLLLTDEDNLDILSSSFEIKEIALLLKSVPVARLREIYNNFAGNECAAPLAEESVKKMR